MRRGIVPLALMFATGAIIAQSQSPAAPDTKTSDAPDNVSQEHIYGPKEGAKPPKRTYSPDPKYPKDEREARRQGTVVLRRIVGADGLPRDIAVLRTLGPEFDEAAIDAVKKWKFSPATKDGKAVAAKVSVQVNFRLY